MRHLQINKLHLGILVIIALSMGCSNNETPVEPIDESLNTIVAGEIPNPSNHLVLNNRVLFNRTSDEVFRVELFSEEKIGFSVSNDIDEEMLDLNITSMKTSLIDLDQEVKFPNVTASQDLFLIGSIFQGETISSSDEFIWFSPQTIFFGKDNAFLTVQDAFNGFFVPFRIERNDIDRMGWIQMKLITSDIKVEGFELVDLAWIDLSE
ncbi:MAG: hypothetical protein ABJG47_00605 [Ekhidna sp.]